MANKLYEESSIQNIANAIRTKNGSSDTYTVSEMATAIENIPSGGGDDFVDTYNDNNIRYFIKKVPSITTTYSNINSFFSELPNLEEIQGFAFPNATSADSAFSNCPKLKEIPNMNTTNITNMQKIFNGCRAITKIPQLNTTNVTNFYYMCQNCVSLTDFPQLDFSSAVYLGNMFNGVYTLTDASLNNILLSCAGATSYTGTKTLNALGLTSANYYPASRIQALSNYQSFIDAGWTIGH